MLYDLDLGRLVSVIARIENDGDREDALTFVYKLVPVPPCEHGNIDGHWIRTTGLNREGNIWCEGAALEEGT